MLVYGFIVNGWRTENRLQAGGRLAGCEMVPDRSNSPDDLFFGLLSQRADFGLTFLRDKVLIMK